MCPCFRAETIANRKIWWTEVSRDVSGFPLPPTACSRGGSLSGRVPPADTKGDIRVVRMPRFQQGNLEKNWGLWRPYDR